MTRVTVTPTTEPTLQEQLAAVEAMNELLVEEANTALELAAEDREWRLAGLHVEQEFSRQGLAALTRNCEVMTIASPLIKRGVQLRTSYIWGQGVSVQARAGAGSDDDGQDADGLDVNAVVQEFWDDPGNQRAIASAEAHEQNERTLATKGNWFLAFFPDPSTGRVRVRRVPFEEIADKYTNPDDRETDWFFLREYTETVVEPGTSPGTFRRRRQTRRVFHPALGHEPAAKDRPKVIDNIPIDWDVPILHVTVNRPEGWTWGVPDVYASLPWARAYEGFLTDWARLVKALSKFAWRLTGDKASKVQRAVDKIRTSLPLPARASDVPPLGDSNAGGVAAMGPGANLEAIPKSGATIDADSGRPLASLVAAGLGVSVVSLLADPGVTGARAVAEALDKPDSLAMQMRQAVWRSVLQTILTYVVEQAVVAPSGPLTGTVDVDEYGRKTITLAGDTDPSVEVTFPPLDDLDPFKLVAAIVQADGTDKLPPVWVVKSLLRALGEQDVDEVIKPFLDDEENWIDPRETAGDAAAARFRRGEDPAETV